MGKNGVVIGLGPADMNRDCRWYKRFICGCDSEPRGKFAVLGGGNRAVVDGGGVVFVADLEDWIGHRAIVAIGDSGHKGANFSLSGCRVAQILFGRQNNRRSMAVGLAIGQEIRQTDVIGNRCDHLCIRIGQIEVILGQTATGVT